MSKRGTCVRCGKPDTTLPAGNMCGVCYNADRKKLDLPPAILADDEQEEPAAKPAKKVKTELPPEKTLAQAVEEHTDLYRDAGGSFPADEIELPKKWATPVITRQPVPTLTADELRQHDEIAFLRGKIEDQLNLWQGELRDAANPLERALRFIKICNAVDELGGTE